MHIYKTVADVENCLKKRAFFVFRLGGDVEWWWLAVTDSHSHQLRAMLSQGVQRVVSPRENIVNGNDSVDGRLATILRFRIGAKGVERQYEQCHI